MTVAAQANDLPTPAAAGWVDPATDDSLVVHPLLTEEARSIVDPDNAVPSDTELDLKRLAEFLVTDPEVLNTRPMLLAGRWDAFWAQPNLTTTLAAALGCPARARAV